LKVGADRPVGFYHGLSRVVDPRFIFEETEKEHFRALLREGKAFCEVQVLTYCLMSLGSREFVEDLLRTFRARFGPKRKDGARRLRGLADAELFTLRDLRLNVFG
jgi:hypothetical protein